MTRNARLILLILLSLHLLPAPDARAGHLSPGLEAYLADKHPGGDVSVLVVLQEQVDLAALDHDLKARRAARAERHAHVVGALQSIARQTQGPILADLAAREGKGITSHRAYWLLNAILVTGSEAAVREVAARGDVDVVELNLVPALIGPVDDRGAGAGQAPTSGIGITPGVVNIGARRVWDELGIRGEGALIGTMDTGVAVGHPALGPRWRGHEAPWQHCWLDAIGGDTQAPWDLDGHGTHVTGTICGLAPGDTIGVAPEARWIAANTIFQLGGPELDADVLASLQFFTDPDGDPATIDDVPDVVQNSWGVNQDFAGYYQCDSRWWQAIDACETAGVVLVWSAGNEGPQPMSLRSPADRATTLDNAFSVGSTQLLPPFPISSFSSRGPAGPDCGPQEHRVKPEVVAPGSNIYSAFPPEGYFVLSGTSMAGPHVAGVVALMRSADPDLEVDAIKRILRETALDLGAVGEDNTYGHGLVDAYAAVAMVLGGVGWVEGAVIDQAGAPITGARVAPVGGPQHDITGADGRYRLLLPAGDAVLQVAAFAFEEATVPVAVPADGTVERVLMLARAPAAVLEARVLAVGQSPPGAVPAAGARVVVEGTPLAALVADAQGLVTATLPSGRDYTLDVRLDGGGGLLRQTVPLLADLALDLYLGPVVHDGFETGALDLLPWQTGGDAAWFVQDQTVRTGTFAARSGGITHGQRSDLELVVDAGSGGEVSFWRRVSSEANYDFLEFWINGQRHARWSGQTGWGRHAVTLPAGVHTLLWRYEKDPVATEGLDHAWLDDLALPTDRVPAPMLVAAPWTLTATVTAGASIEVPLLVTNQGQLPLQAVATPGAAWIGVVPAVIMADPAGYASLTATLDAGALLPGLHTASIRLASNDPLNPRQQVVVALTVTDAATGAGPPPAAFALFGAAPNPFNPRTTIRYSVPTEQPVRLRLYDLQGRLVRTLVDGMRPGGHGEVMWDGLDERGRAVASGTYLARLEAAGLTAASSLVLVR